MKFLSRFAAVAALGLAAASAGAQSAEHTLKISSWGPPTSQINTVMWPNIIKQIEEATDGRVTAEIVYGLAPPPAQFDLVFDGAADMTWIFPGYNPGRFQSPKILEIPGFDVSSKDLSGAYWKVQEEFFDPANEYDGVKLIGVMVHGPGQLHTVEPVQSLDDIAELKLRTGGGVAADVVAALGASRIQQPVTKVYETIASSAADGTFLTIEGRESYRLVEIAPHMFEMPGGFYRGAFALIMNQDAFDRLPDDLRGKLDEAFGFETSRIAGDAWDVADEIGLAATKEASDNTISVASEADQKKFAELSAVIRDTVLEAVGESGIDAQGAYSRLQDLVGSD